LSAEPGTTFQYSNANYVLLSHLIEVLDEQSFEQALKACIFDPLGMTNSFVQVPHSDAIAVATGYRLWFGIPRPWQPVPDAERDRRMIGAGGVSASIEDLAHYVEAVRNRDPRIVPEGADRPVSAQCKTAVFGHTLETREDAKCASRGLQKSEL
jgi:CubicO group peptidase (beta-lactamase class C family)